MTEDLKKIYDYLLSIRVDMFTTLPEAEVKNIIKNFLWHYGSDERWFINPNPKKIKRTFQHINRMINDYGNANLKYNKLDNIHIENITKLFKPVKQNEQN